MSNPLDSLIDAVKASEPRPEAIDRAVSALGRPHPPRYVPLAVGAAAVSLFVLWPHGESGTAWAQIAQQDLPERYHETQVVIAKGQSRLFQEQWVDRLADATRSHYFLPKSFPDPQRSYLSTPLEREFESIRSPAGTYYRQQKFATFTRKPAPKSEFDPRSPSNMSGRTAVERIFESKDIHQLGIQEGVQTRVGKADRYELERPQETIDPKTRRWVQTGRNRFVAYVEPKTKRVLGIDSPSPNGDVWQTTIEYPERFSDDTFATPKIPGVRVFDLDELNAKVDARLKTPIKTLRAGGQQSVLRLVAQDEMKNLWILWSGARPNGDLAQKVRVLGMWNGAAHSTLGLVSKGFNGRFDQFGGHSVSLKRKIDRVDLEIPVFAPGPSKSRFVGTVTVRNVDVLQLPFVDGLDSVRKSKH